MKQLWIASLMKRNLDREPSQAMPVLERFLFHTKAGEKVLAWMEVHQGLAVVSIDELELVERHPVLEGPPTDDEVQRFIENIREQLNDRSIWR